VRLKDNVQKLEEEVDSMKKKSNTMLKDKKQTETELNATKQELVRIKVVLQQSDQDFKQQLNKADVENQQSDQELNFTKQELAKAKVEKQLLEKKLSNAKQVTDNVIAEKQQYQHDLNTTKQDLNTTEERQNTSELYKRLDNHKDNTNPQSKTTGLIIMNKDCINKVTDFIQKSDVTWDICPDIDSIAALNEALQKEDQLNRIQKFGIVLCMLGSVDIVVKSVTGERAFSELIKSMRKVAEKTDTVVVQLPPTTKGTSQNIELGVFNLRIHNLKEEKIQSIIIKDKIDMIPRSKSVEKDGITPSDNVGKLISDAISDQITIPDPSEKTEDEEPGCEFDPDENVVEMMEFPFKSFGKVVGTDGSTIRSIKTQTSTSIYVLTWDEYSQEKNGAIIRGTRRNVKLAKEEIKVTLEEETERKDRNKNKRRKAVGYKPPKNSLNTK
jgi:hypothetical protein